MSWFEGGFLFPAENRRRNGEAGPEENLCQESFGHEVGSEVQG